MRRSLSVMAVCAAVVAVLGVPAAAADEPQDASAAEEALLGLEQDLTGEAVQPGWGEHLPIEARVLRLEARLEDLSRKLFRVRYEARRAVATLTPMAVVDHLERLEEGRHVPGLAMDLGDAGDVAALQSVLADWVRLRRVIDRLSDARDDLAAILGEDPDARVCPVTGSRTFENVWGEDRPGGRPHRGIDIDAAFGTPLVAIEDGVILQAGRHWAGGIQVYLLGDHTEDVYYYAHMSWWAPGVGSGAHVEAGDLIGWVGVSGNAGSPHLHLGWMPAAGSVDLDALDNPYRMLLDVCG